MARFRLIPFFAFGVFLLAAGTALAQAPGAVPTVPALVRGPGFYFSLIKILAAALVVLAWVHSADWVSVDAYEHRLDYLRWNGIVVGGFLGGFLLLLLIPWFWLGFPLLLGAYIGPFVYYVRDRNRRVSLTEQVFTKAHLRFWFSETLARFGVKFAAEAVDPHDVGPVKLAARGGPTPIDENVRLLTARQSPGFGEARKIIEAGLSRRATAILLEYLSKSVTVRHQVDGVWLQAPLLPREQAEPPLESLKLLCGLDRAERQKQQDGKFTVKYEETEYATTLFCKGISTGERVLVEFSVKQTRFENLDALGMRPKMQEQLKELLAQPKGLFLFSAPPEGGLRTLTNLGLRGSDRLTRDFIALESETAHYEEVENIPVTTFKAAGEDSFAATLARAARAEPQAIVVRDLPDTETVRLLCNQAGQRLVVSTIRARDAAEALLRVMLLKVPSAEFVPCVSAVLSQRLVRKLCDTCKQAYTPSAELIQQWGISADRVGQFYCPPVPPTKDQEKKEKEKICPKCGGVGYFGRTGIFELLVLDDTVRNVLRTTPKIDLVRQAARKAGMHTLQEEGIALVVQGVTSLAELQRVLKPPAQP
jgi:type II secretory ATPase GspE/PulE/Tfp pilus assembly ATPase PilB-like protein